MTCIVGIEAEGGAVIGGDAVHASGWRRTNSAQPKVIRVGPAVLGAAGSSRVSQVVAGAMRDLEWGPSTIEWFVEALVPRLRSALRDAGALRMENGMEEMAATLVVGHGAKVFTIWGDFQIEPPSRGYQAVGSGAEVAVGALYAIDALNDVRAVREFIGPVERAHRALEAASEHVASVGPPFVVLRAGGRDA